MFARKFIDRVDTHADQLCEEFMQKMQRSDNCKELLHKVPVEELRQSTREMYRNMTDWLLNNAESVSEERYVNLGMQRARQSVPSSELFWVVCATREYFWEYMERETLLDEPADFWGGIQLLHSLDRFFDRALNFVIIGYQSGGREELARVAAISASSEQNRSGARLEN
jgi:hypothetical protein